MKSETTLSTWSLLQADLFRLDGEQGKSAFLLSFWRVPTFRYMVLFRLCQRFKTNRILKLSVYPLLLFWFQGLGVKYGLRVPLSCRIGPGFLIEHWGGIWVNPSCVIGSNVNISQGVTLGVAGNGANRGVPTIGDRVFLGPGSMILGNITVGNGAVVSANSVALQDIQENGVVIGNPGRVFSHQGSSELIKHPIS
jgi:serine O-acetyltransferase